VSAQALLRQLLLAAALALCAGAWPAAAQPVQDPTPLRFQDEAEARRFQALTEELRCVMCQNQSLADSDAMIAHHLRREVLSLMREGRSDREIREFLVARYGEFVLYRPPFGARTLLLWLGPLLLLLGGGVLVWRIVRARSTAAPVPPDEEQEW
jgi:cytochrome c-type biogenesis protein CcmH